METQGALIRKVKVVSFGTTNVTADVILKVVAVRNFLAVKERSLEALSVSESPSDMSAPDNDIYDPDYPDRFKNVKRLISPFSDTIISIIFDKKYNDFLVCPDFDIIDKNFDGIPSVAIEVDSIVSVNIKTNKPTVNVKSDERYYSKSVCSFTEPKDGLLNVPSVVRVIRMLGRENEGVTGGCETMFNGVYNYTGSRFVPGIFIDLGTLSSVFDDTNFKIGISKVYMETRGLLSTSSAIYDASAVEGKLGIILDW